MMVWFNKYQFVQLQVCKLFFKKNHNYFFVFLTNYIFFAYKKNLQIMYV